MIFGLGWAIIIIGFAALIGAIVVIVSAFVSVILLGD